MTTQDSAVKVVATAMCVFPKDEARKLYATRFSLEEMFILSMQPPPIMTTFSVVLQPTGQNELPPAIARVVSTYCDPVDIGKCGFGAVITEIDSKTREAYNEALEELGIESDQASKRPSIERRADPRIWTDLNASVEVEDKKFETTLVNLSMSGALVAFGSVQLPAEIKPDQEIDIKILDENNNEQISIKACVVRAIGIGIPSCVGVRFIDITNVSASKLEEIMLQNLSELMSHN